jgi:hypothetical protein
MNRTSAAAFTSESSSRSAAMRSLAKGTQMTREDQVEQMVKTIDRAIAQAEELGMAHAVYVLRVARLEADLTEIGVETRHPAA